MKISVRTWTSLNSTKHHLDSQFFIVAKELRYSVSRRTLYYSFPIQEPFLDSLMPRLADLPLMSLPSGVPDQQAEVVVDEEDEVAVARHLDKPVVAVVGAPGHGKSSVANLILGEERFRVRGRNVFAEDQIQVGTSSFSSALCVAPGGSGSMWPAGGDRG